MRSVQCGVPGVSGVPGVPGASGGVLGMHGGATSVHSDAYVLFI